MTTIIHSTAGADEMRYIIPLYRVSFTLWAIARRYPVAGSYCGRWTSPALSREAR